MEVYREDGNIIVHLPPKEKRTINESFLTMFGGAVKMMLKRMFGGGNRFVDNVKVRGKESEVESFVNALKKEKDYMKAFHKYGLDDPRSLKQKGELEKAVKDFESETGISWPFTD